MNLSNVQSDIKQWLMCTTSPLSLPSYQLHGKLRVILEPLIGDVPLVGAITMFFIRRPVSLAMFL